MGKEFVTRGNRRGRVATGTAALLCLLALAALSWADGARTLHIPFDGDLEPTVACGGKTLRSFGGTAYVEGVKGRALVVGGENRCIYSADGNVALTQGTCSVWARPLDWEPADEEFYFFVTLRQRDSEGHRRIVLYKHHEDAVLTLLFQDAPSAKASYMQKPMFTWQKGEWRHLAFTWDGAGDVRLYVNGRPAGTMGCFAIPGEGWDLVVGIPWPSWAHLGAGRTAIDELTCYSRVLSEKEILALYDGVAGESPAAGLARSETDRPVREGNLASAGNGAFVLASSFKNSKTFYPDNLIDGNRDTVWRAWDSSFPQWVELRWPHPVRMNEIAFEEVPPTHVAAYSVQAWRQGQWEPLSKQTCDAGCTFPEVVTDRLRLVLESGEGRHTQLSELAVYGPPQPLVTALEPYWNAWYIWYPEPDGRHKGNSPRYFRKSFDIEDLAAVKLAHIQLRSNDYYKAFVNGREVATGSTEITAISVKDCLRQGTNSLAIVADLVKDPGKFGWGELLAELTLSFDTRNVYVGTDTTWKSHDTLVTGWEGLDFDDSAWKNAAPYVQPPDGPWGKIPYCPTACREAVTVAGVSVPPEPAKPGGPVRIDISVTPTQKLRNDYVFIMELKGKEVLPASCNFHLTSVVVDPERPTSEWPVDEPATVSAELQLPTWSPNGAVPIHLHALAKSSGASLDIRRETETGTVPGSPASQVGAVTIARHDAEPRFGTLPECRVEKRNGAFGFRIGDEFTTPASWLNNHCWSYERFHEYSKTGINLFWISAPSRIDGSQENMARTNDHLDAQIQALLAVNPDAHVMVSLELRPSQEWLKANPNERMITGLGTPGPVSFASREYHRLIRGHIETVIRFLNAQSYGGRIIGYRPLSFGLPDSALGTNTGNTWQTDRSKVTMGDYNPQAIALFQDCLREKYAGSEAALRKAWKDDTVTFDTARPILAELTQAPDDGGVFIDPTLGVSTKKYDYLEFLAKLLPWNYFRIARIIKDETGGKAMVGIHYGYVVEHLRGIHPPGPQGDNDFDFPNMLDNPLIDFYCGAVHYGSRLAGCSFQNMFPLASIVLHDRLYVTDADYRTVIAGPVSYGRQRSMRETVAVMERDVATMAIQGFGCWFADLSRGRGQSEVGWFTNPTIHETIGKMNAVYEKALTQPRERTAEIAVFVSGHASYYHDVYNAQSIYNNLIRHMLYGQLPRIGTPFDVYLMEDIANEAVQDSYKMYVFINPFYMSDDEARGVERLKRDGKTLFWFYAPGYVNRTSGLTADNIAAVTGIVVKKKSEAKEDMQYAIVTTGHPVTQSMSEGDTLKTIPFASSLEQGMHPPAFGPVFYIDDPDAATLAAYPDGLAALAAKDMGDWKSVYCAVPYADKRVIRGAAEYAGVHLYCDVDTVLDASNRHVMVHNGFEGAKDMTIHLPQKRTAYDAFTGERVSQDSDSISATLEDCQTKVFVLE